MGKNYFLYKFFLGLAIMITICFFSLKTNAQLWQALPPYNILWPLWSPALSPPDPVTGEPTPLITELKKNTLLPVQPALVWNPDLPYYYLIYNYINPYYPTAAPIVKYWDLAEYAVIGTYGGYIFQDWPPPNLLQIIEPYINTFVTVPNPITLPVGYENLITIDPSLWLNWFVQPANIAWEDAYGVNPNLLTASALLPVNWVYTYYFGPPLVPAI